MHDVFNVNMFTRRETSIFLGGGGYRIFFTSCKFFLKKDQKGVLGVFWKIKRYLRNKSAPDIYHDEQHDCNSRENRDVHFVIAHHKPVDTKYFKDFFIDVLIIFRYIQ